MSRKVWVSENDAAKRIGVHRGTLARWRQDGIGPPCRVIQGNRRVTCRYHVDQLDRWMMVNGSPPEMPEKVR